MKNTFFFVLIIFIVSTKTTAQFAQKNAISSPATGLLIYQTDDTPGFYYYNSKSSMFLIFVSTLWS